jgi:hypothetical protein
VSRSACFADVASFYDFQGFMDGAALSGIAVAVAILEPANR